ncbi:MAG: acyl-CoA/acyl-ACP dehydrogenase [Chloroflexi bacterium]|nr:acyl-CoA/acyl-ACP dehydrogenase [Chloroflexota bacterium]
MYPRDDRQAALLRTAQHLAAGFAERAAEHDREGSFPHENIAAMRDAGYLAIAVPTEYGGAGHSLTAVALAQIALAKGDGSTAVATGMHLMVCGTEGAAHAWPEALRTRIFRDIVEHGALVNNVAAEPELGSPQGGGRPATSLRPDGPGRWRLSGHKTFTTLAPALTYFITYAAVEDGSGDVARVAVHRDRPGIRIEETWDALGMRATGSHDVYFDDVPISDDEFTNRRDPRDRSVAPAAGAAWFPTLIGAASLGVAEAARDYTVHFARTRQPTGAPHPIAKIPAVREQIGRMDAALIAARTLLLATASDWDEHPEARVALGPQVAAAKRLATNAAVEIAEIAMRVVGGVALQRSEPLERYFRDVRSGLVNPPIDARALETIAAAALDGDA